MFITGRWKVNLLCNKEIDWDLSYKIKDFSLHFADYFYHGFAFPLPEDYFDFKKASNDDLREKFAFVMPDYDEDAVYPSDMRKVFAWYQMLMDKNLLDFTEEEAQPEAEAENAAEAPAEKD